MEAFKNTYAQKIFEIISPVLGELMAKGALRSQCKKIGISEDSIQPKDMVLLSDNIGKALILFIGSENARQIIARMKAI
jgi:hypothetical protein